MKILVIGSARTASSALCEHLKINNEPIQNLNEYISQKYNNQYQSLLNILKDSNKVNSRIEKSVTYEGNELLTNVPNYILKVLGCHLGGFSLLFKAVQPEKYDKIYCIERHDFFNQVCSHKIATTESVWHRRLDSPEILEKYEEIKNKNFTVDSGHIIGAAYDIAHYLKCKRYLLTNKIKFEQAYFTDPMFTTNSPIGRYSKNDLDYSNIVNNYKISTDINKLFSKYFDYDSLYHDFENFQHEIFNYFK